MTATPLFHETARQLWVDGKLSRETRDRLMAYPVTVFMSEQAARSFQQLSDAVAQHHGLPGATGYRFTTEEQRAWYAGGSAGLNARLDRLGCATR
jgi:hypothetical protein